jgi:hypothetical protein
MPVAVMDSKMAHKSQGLFIMFFKFSGLTFHQSGGFTLLWLGGKPDFKEWTLAEWRLNKEEEELKKREQRPSQEWR